MKPTNMVATILALILAGANSEARVMLRVRAPPMPMPAKKRRMQNVLKLCTQKSPPLNTENMMRPRMRGIFLPMRSASMPSPAVPIMRPIRPYDTTEPATTGLRVPLLDDVGHHV